MIPFSRLLYSIPWFLYYFTNVGSKPSSFSENVQHHILNRAHSHLSDPCSVTIGLTNLSEVVEESWDVNLYDLLDFALAILSPSLSILYLSVTHLWASFFQQGGAQGGVAFEHVEFPDPLNKCAPLLSGLDLDIPSGSVLALVALGKFDRNPVEFLLERFYDPSSGRVVSTQSAGNCEKKTRENGKQERGKTRHRSDGSKDRDIRCNVACNIVHTHTKKKQSTCQYLENGLWWFRL